MSRARITAGMGFSKPKAVTPEPAPPPVTTTGAEVAAAENQTRQDQRKRRGYQATLLAPNQPGGYGNGGVGKKTLLGG